MVSSSVKRDIYKCQCYLSLAFALCIATDTSAQTSHHQFEISRFLAGRGLSMSDVSSMATVVTRPDFAWASGHTNEIRKGFVQLVPITGFGNPAGYSLVVHYNAVLLQPVGIEVCSNPSDCIEPTLDVDPLKRSLSFSVGGNSWGLKIGEGPCIGTASCTFRIPSWALESRRISGSSAHRAFPSIATIVDFGSWIAIFNGSSGDHWMDLRFPSGSMNRGRLKTASMSVEGMLTLEFTNAAMVLDFEHDRAMLADASGIAFGTSGIGDLASGNWQYVLTKPDIGSKFLTLSSDLALWSDGYAAIDMQKPSPQAVGSYHEIYETGLVATRSFGTAGESIVTLLTQSTDRIRLKRYDKKSEVFQSTGSSWKLGSFKESDTLMRRDIMRLTAEGLRVLSSGADAPTSLSMQNKTIYLLSSGSAFVESRTGENCSYIHFDQHPSDSSSFKESGLSTPCGSGHEFDASAHGISATSLSNDSIRISILRK